MKFKEATKGKSFRKLLRKNGYEVYLVDEYRNKGNLLETINTGKPLATITASDITSGNVNDIMNTAKNKFLGDVLEGKYSKEVAQKEFKTFSEKLEQYATKTKENRTYIKDSKNNTEYIVIENGKALGVTQRIK